MYVSFTFRTFAPASIIRYDHIIDFSHLCNLRLIVRARRHFVNTHTTTSTLAMCVCLLIRHEWAMRCSSNCMCVAFSAPTMHQPWQPPSCPLLLTYRPNAYGNKSAIVK